MLVQPQVSRLHPPRSPCQRNTSTGTEPPELGQHRTGRCVSIPKDAISSGSLARLRCLQSYCLQLVDMELLGVIESRNVVCRCAMCNAMCGWSPKAVASAGLHVRF